MRATAARRSGSRAPRTGIGPPESAVAPACAAATLRSRRLDGSLTAIVVASRTVPAIVLTPLHVLWLGCRAAPRVAICALVAFFPMAVTAREGLCATAPRLPLLLRSLEARPWSISWPARRAPAVT